MRHWERQFVAGVWLAAVGFFVVVIYYLYPTNGGSHGQSELIELKTPAVVGEPKIHGNGERSKDAAKEINLDKWVIEVLGGEQVGKDDAVNDSKGKLNNKTFPTAPAPTKMGCMDLENLDKDKALVIGHRRKDRGFLTIGITNAKRKNISYLKTTLKSLIDNASEEDRSQLRIVVFACDFDDRDRQKAREILSGNFAEHVKSGLLQLIQAPRSFYPPLENLKRTFNDPEERVRWRSKENMDNVFLFAYSVNMSDYYMLLDDDMYTFPGYFKTIQNFVAKHRNDTWSHLDISELGTGKVFRDGDLLLLARFLVQFYQEQPVDMLINARMNIWIQPKHFVVTPPLFKHLGKISTLGLKTK